MSSLEFFLRIIKKIGKKGIYLKEIDVTHKKTR